MNLPHRDGTARELVDPRLVAIRFQQRDEARRGHRAGVRQCHVRDVREPRSVDDAQLPPHRLDRFLSVFDREVDAGFGRAPTSRRGQPQRQRRARGSNELELRLEFPEQRLAGVVHDGDVWPDAARRLRVEADPDLVDAFGERAGQEHRDLAPPHRDRLARAPSATRVAPSTSNR